MAAPLPSRAVALPATEGGDAGEAAVGVGSPLLAVSLCAISVTTHPIEVADNLGVFSRLLREISFLPSFFLALLWQPVPTAPKHWSIEHLLVLLDRCPLTAPYLDSMGPEGEDMPVRELGEGVKHLLVATHDDESPPGLRLAAPGGVLVAVDLNVGDLERTLDLRVPGEEGTGQPVRGEGSEVVLQDAREVWSSHHGLLWECVELQALHFLLGDASSEAAQEI